jgi:hypothetical protein
LEALSELVSQPKLAWFEATDDALELEFNGEIRLSY